MDIKKRNRRLLRIGRLQAARLHRDPEYARQWFIKYEYVNPDGTLHENYGGEPNNRSASQRQSA